MLKMFIECKKPQKTPSGMHHWISFSLHATAPEVTRQTLFYLTFRRAPWLPFCILLRLEHQINNCTRKSEKWNRISFENAIAIQKNKSKKSGEGGKYYESRAWCSVLRAGTGKKTIATDKIESTKLFSRWTGTFWSKGLCLNKENSDTVGFFIITSCWMQPLISGDPSQSC